MIPYTIPKNCEFIPSLENCVYILKMSLTMEHGQNLAKLGFFNLCVGLTVLGICDGLCQTGHSSPQWWFHGHLPLESSTQCRQQHRRALPSPVHSCPAFRFPTSLPPQNCGVSSCFLLVDAGVLTPETTHPLESGAHPSLRRDSRGASSMAPGKSLSGRRMGSRGQTFRE